MSKGENRRPPGYVWPMKQTLEQIAAIRLSAAESAMRAAAGALDDLGSGDAKLHARELRGAIKIVRSWELALRRLHSKSAG